MHTYKISVKSIGGYANDYYVTSERRPLTHQAWNWLKKKHGSRYVYLDANSISVTLQSPVIEKFEV